MQEAIRRFGSILYPKRSISVGPFENYGFATPHKPTASAYTKQCRRAVLRCLCEYSQEDSTLAGLVGWLFDTSLYIFTATLQLFSYKGNFVLMRSEPSTLKRCIGLIFRWKHKRQALIEPRWAAFNTSVWFFWQWLYLKAPEATLWSLLYCFMWHYDISHTVHWDNRHRPVIGCRDSTPMRQLEHQEPLLGMPRSYYLQKS